MKIELVSPDGITKQVPLGFSWTTLLFGFFVPLYRGDMKWFVVSLVLSLVTNGLSWVIFPFFYNKLYYRDLMKQGFLENGNSDTQVFENIGILRGGNDMALKDLLKTGSQQAVSSVKKTYAHTAATTQREEAEINRLKSTVAAIDGELTSAYTLIGKKYFEYALKSGDVNESLGINDILVAAEQKVERKKELQKEIHEIEKRLKDQLLLQEKARIQLEVDTQLEKLENAKNLGIISDAEYEEKIEQANRPLVNFEAIRNVEKQFEIGLISLAEKNQKLAALK